MKKLITTLTLLMTMFFAVNAQALSYTETRIGNHSFYSGDINGSATHIGNHSFYILH